MKIVLWACMFLLWGALVGAENPKVVMETTMGRIVVELYPDKAPKTVANFLAYVDEGFYDGTIFHRVIPGFVIQGGGYTADFRQKPTRPPIPNEADNGLSNLRGTIAMARTADPHSATSQFFINLVDNKRLDPTGKGDARAWGYAVFGKVVEGMDVVDAIARVRTGPRGPFPSDCPLETVLVQRARRMTGQDKGTGNLSPKPVEGDSPATDHGP